MTITIKDIARECGVSISAVSLVLNNRPNRISEKTSALIIETARSLNYRPNQIAVSLVTRKTKIIGLILPDISNVFFAEIGRYVEEEASQAGYTVIYGNTQDRIASEFDYIQSFLSKGLSGIILIRSAEQNDEIEEQVKLTIQRAEIPFIFVDRSYTSINIKNLSVDQINGGYIATRHLIDNGHKKIACICGPLHLQVSLDRLAGYRLAMDEAHISIEPDWIIEGNFRVESGFAAADKIISKSFTAIFASNDLMAMGVYQACFKHRISIPEQLSIVGFDNIIFSSIVSPALTTIEQPMKQVCHDACICLIHYIETGKLDSTGIIYQPKLIQRDSTRKI